MLLLVSLAAIVPITAQQTTGTLLGTITDSTGATIAGVTIRVTNLATGASWVCYFRALQVGEASKVAPVDKLSLVLVAIFAAMFLGERPNFREWFGIALVGVGVLILGFKR